MPGATFLDCGRLRLAPPEEDDIPLLQAAVNHPEIRRYISAFEGPYDETAYREQLWPVESDADALSVLVVPKNGPFADEPVGSVQLLPIRRPAGYANFGVWLHPKAWGNGYALEASAHLIDHGFDHLRLHRVGATAMAPNDRSAALLDRLGFRSEGVARDAGFVEGDHVDVERYGLLADEWDGVEAVLDRR